MTCEGTKSDAAGVGRADWANVRNETSYASDEGWLGWLGVFEVGDFEFASMNRLRYL